MCRLLIGTTLYTFALGAMAALGDEIGSTTPISAFILLAMAISVCVHIRTSGFPARAYGFNTSNWRVAIKEAVLFSLPVAGLIVLAIAILIHTLPEMANLPLFEARPGVGASGSC